VISSICGEIVGSLVGYFLVNGKPRAEAVIMDKDYAGGRGEGSLLIKGDWNEEVQEKSEVYPPHPSPLPFGGEGTL
jgi:hypothetical protein